MEEVKEVIMEPSFFKLMFKFEIRKDSQIRKIAIPEIFDKLIEKSKNNEKLKRISVKLIDHFTYGKNLERSEERFEFFLTNYKILKEQHKVFLIKEKDVDEKIYNTCIKTYHREEFKLKMSEQKNIFGEIMGVILGYLKKDMEQRGSKFKYSSKLVASYTRKFSDMASKVITYIELPKKLKTSKKYLDQKIKKINDILKSKQDFFNEFFERIEDKELILFLLTLVSCVPGIGCVICIKDP